MAKVLQTARLYEGVIFHAYHAFEAICCAGLEDLSDGMEHDRRLLLFIAPYPDGLFKQKFFQVYYALASLTRSRTPVGTRIKLCITKTELNPTNDFKQKMRKRQSSA